MLQWGCINKLCKLVALLALLLQLDEGFFWALEFVETCTHVVCYS